MSPLQGMSEMHPVGQIPLLGDVCQWQGVSK